MTATFDPTLNPSLPTAPDAAPTVPGSVAAMRLSIVIPVYNEGATIHTLIGMVVNADLPAGMAREIICVNDCSTDDTRAKLDQLPTSFPGVEFKIHHKPQNEGKGAALRDGFARATGDLVLIQDADLEYDPEDYGKLIKPILDAKADVVYGSRFIGEPHRVLYFWHSVANKCLTALSNMFTNLNLTDMEVCYKVFRKSVLDRITLRCNRFGFEPEVTAKVARLRPPLRIYEVGVAYHGRSYEEGKKITWKDGIKAVLAIIRFRFFD
jgi:glycosyltransferase involved in cell wall biosynthesis